MEVKNFVFTDNRGIKRCCASFAKCGRENVLEEQRQRNEWMSRSFINIDYLRHYVCHFMNTRSTFITKSTWVFVYKEDKNQKTVYVYFSIIKDVPFHKWRQFWLVSFKTYKWVVLDDLIRKIYMMKSINFISIKRI